MLENDKKDRISRVVIKILCRKFDDYPVSETTNRNAPFHTAFLNAFKNHFEDIEIEIPFLISISSWMHGLNTTLGQTFFEEVAHILSDGLKYEYTARRSGNLPLSVRQKTAITNLITDLSNRIQTPNLDRENSLIISVEDEELSTHAIDFSADVLINDNTQITAIELKSVHPNSGEMRGEKHKILEGKAALNNQFPGKNVKFYLGFPFDPLNDTSEIGSEKTRFMSSVINMNKFFSQNEVLIAEELWDTLSGEANTMQQLLDIINSIATVEFEDKFMFINDHEKRIKSQDEYIRLLNDWNLFEELEILDIETTMRDTNLINNNISKIINQPVFKTNDNDLGVYNYNRGQKIKEYFERLEN